jgi:hypothetical protein
MPCAVNLLRIPALSVFSGDSVCSFKSFQSECRAMEAVKGAILDFCVSVFQSHVDVLVVDDIQLFDKVCLPSDLNTSLVS